VKYPFGTAYSFRSSAEHREYYNQWARRYDAEFAEYEGYDYPSRLAALFKALAMDGDGPIADIGCGTGLVGLALVDLMPSVEVCGFDISAAMLEIAARTGAYVDVAEVDLTSPPSGLPGSFGAVVSAGAFTLGHLGPDVLATIVALGRPSALFVLGVNSQHFAQADFASALEALRLAGAIGPWQVVEVPIFGEPAGDDPSRVGSVVVFRLP
jgi:predicted TPR repeat methyltransferase